MNCLISETSEGILMDVWGLSKGLVRKASRIPAKVNNQTGLTSPGLGQPAMESNVGSDPEIRVLELGTLVGSVAGGLFKCGGVGDCLINGAATSICGER